MLLLLLACTRTEPEEALWRVPDGATYALHDPEVYPWVWPDMAHTVADASAGTGVRVRLRGNRAV